MNKEIINVPKGIRFINEWNNFNLPEFPCIINKQITGCGFTEYCLSNLNNVILCSPRRILLENKKDQHPEINVFYFKNDSEKLTEFDKDLTKDKLKHEQIILEDLQTISQLKDKLKHLLYQCLCSRTPLKILVTYDSFRHVREVLENEIGFNSFYTVIDEFQSIFTDSKFKSSTEMELLKYLNNINRLSFVSATPMIDKYLDMLEEFNSLPYYELDWAAEDSTRVIRPQLEPYPSKSIVATAISIIESYKSGNFERSNYIDQNGNIGEVLSTECVIYVNSVKNICELISKAELKPEQCNILCAKTEENEKKIRKAFKLTKKALPNPIGEIPKEGKEHKMFTFCTRTVYLGADFYSKCARTFIFSDANVDCLAVDITLDLPQILGRQRLNENPWKHRAILYYKSTLDKNVVTEQDFKDRLEKKLEATNILLNVYNQAKSNEKHTLAETFERDVKSTNYRYNFVAVNRHAGSDLIPEFNNLVMVAELRSYEIQQIDYKNRFTLFNSLITNNNISNSRLDSLVAEFDDIQKVEDKLRYLSRVELTNEELNLFLERIPMRFKNYYITLGPDRFPALKFNIPDLEREYQKIVNNQTVDLSEYIYSAFKEGEKYTNQFIKNTLKLLYDELNYQKTPKAIDLLEFFELKVIKITDKDTGKRSDGYLIIKKK